MIKLKNTSDKQTFHIPRSVMEAEFVSGYEAKDVSIIANGTYQILPSKGKRALSAVNLDVDIQIDPTPYYNEGFRDGIADQKAKLDSVDISANGTYNSEDGYNNVRVNIDTEPFYNEGYEMGVADQKAQLTSIDITSNGTYENPDGYKTVNVDVGIIPNFQDKEVILTDNGEYSITPDEGYDGLDEVKVTVELDTSNIPFVVPGWVRFAYSENMQFPEGKWDWSEIEKETDLPHLFYNCTSLKIVPKLKLSKLVVANCMFQNCSSLEDLDVAEWNTSELRSADYMFSSTKIRKLPQINTSQVKSMPWMFNSCSNLTEANLDTSSTTDMTGLFSSCSNLRIVSELDASKVTSSLSSYSSPFNNCYLLRYFGGFKGLKVNMYLDKCYSLSYESLMNVINKLADGVSGKTLYLHQDCVNMLSDDDIAIATSKGWSISPARTITEPVIVTALNQIPSTTYQITSRTYDFSQYSGSWQANGYNTYTALPARTNIYSFEGDLSSTTDARKMFGNSTKLSYVTLTGTQNITNAANMFASCSSLISLTMMEDASNITDVTNMFYNISTEGTFYYNPAYDYSKIISALPPTWTAVPLN